MNKNRPISHCLKGDGSSKPGTTLNQLTIEDMIGLRIFVLSFGVAGVTVSMFTPQKKESNHIYLESRTTQRR